MRMISVVSHAFKHRFSLTLVFVHQRWGDVITALFSALGFFCRSAGCWLSKTEDKNAFQAHYTFHNFACKNPSYWLNNILVSLDAPNFLFSINFSTDTLKWLLFHPALMSEFLSSLKDHIVWRTWEAALVSRVDWLTTHHCVKQQRSASRHNCLNN